MYLEICAVDALLEIADLVVAMIVGIAQPGQEVVVGVVEGIVGLTHVHGRGRVATRVAVQVEHAHVAELMTSRAISTRDDPTHAIGSGRVLSKVGRLAAVGRARRCIERAPEKIRLTVDDRLLLKVDTAERSHCTAVTLDRVHVDSSGLDEHERLATATRAAERDGLRGIARHASSLVRRRAVLFCVGLVAGRRDAAATIRAHRYATESVERLSITGLAWLALDRAAAVVEVRVMSGGAFAVESCFVR